MPANDRGNTLLILEKYIDTHAGHQRRLAVEFDLNFKNFRINLVAWPLRPQTGRANRRCDLCHFADKLNTIECVRTHNDALPDAHFFDITLLNFSRNLDYGHIAQHGNRLRAG